MAREQERGVRESGSGSGRTEEPRGSETAQARVRPVPHSSSPIWVVGIGPPLGQIEQDYAELLAEADTFADGGYASKHRQCAKDALALIAEVKRLLAQRAAWDELQAKEVESDA